MTVENNGSSNVGANGSGGNGAIAPQTISGFGHRRGHQDFHSATGSPSINVAFVLNAARQWWKVALPAGLLLAAVASVLILLAFKPKYEADALLQVESNSPFLAFQLKGQDAAQTFVATQMRLIMDPLVLGQVLSNREIKGLPELAGKPAPMEWIKKNIQVKQIGLSELFTISYTSSDPESAKEIVNAVKDSYMEQRAATEDGDIVRLIEILVEENQLRENDVKRGRENYREQVVQLSGVDPFAAKVPTQTGGGTGNKLGNLEGRLSNTMVDRAVLEAQIKVQEESIESENVEVPRTLVEAAVAQDREIMFMEESLAADGILLRNYASTYAKPETRQPYLDLAERIREKEEQLATAKQEIAARVEEDLRRNYATGRKDGLAELRRRLNSLVLLEEFLQDRLDGEREDVTEFKGDTVDLEFTRKELARAEQVSDMLADRINQLKTEQRAPARVSSLRDAYLPVIPVEKHPIKQLILALFASLGLPFGLAVLWERMVRRVNDSSQIKEQSHLALLGEISSLPLTMRPRDSSKRLQRDYEMFEESVNILRTRLATSDFLKETRTIAVTSATSNEGKTSLAVQLAVSTAVATNSRVVIIDGDMRSPDLHNVFGGSVSPGLADLLDQQCELEEAIVTEWNDLVHVIPAGTSDKTPHKLLGNGEFKQLLQKLSLSYDYIVVDTPPVLAAGEALVLSKAADACLLCVMQDVSRIPLMIETYDRLLTANANPLGVVLNGVPGRRYRYRYGSYAYGDA